MKKIKRFIIQLIIFSFLSYLLLLIFGIIISFAELLPMPIIIIITMIVLAYFMLKV